MSDSDQENKIVKEIGGYTGFWCRTVDKMPSLLKKNGSYNFPLCMLTIIWLLFFNPISILLYFYGLGMFLLSKL